jgi:hypothetical protein
MRHEDERGLKAGSWFAGLQWALRGTPLDQGSAISEIGIDALGRCMSHRHVHLNTVVARRDLVSACGGFWESVRFAEDFDFVLRIADRSRRILYRNRPVAVMNVIRHERAYSAVNEIERTVLSMAVSHHLQMVGVRPEVAACARRLESWLLLKLARYARQQGAGRRYWTYVLRSLSVRPSRAGLAMLFGREAAVPVND